jgi:hypothetical protein
VCFFWKVVFEKLIFKLSCIYLLLEKLINKKHFLVNEKHFQSKNNSAWFQEKYFSFGRKILSGSCEKFRNIILFADYIKFGPQTFNSYIYIF